jgi:hypothetical protein
MIRSFKGEEGEFGVKSFFVRWTAVLRALNWLKKYNQIYKESVTDVVWDARRYMVSQ